MRCTRCDGFAVPQAVGIAPDGTVVFGWCRQCLADTDCDLVEVAAAGPADLRLSFTSGRSTRQPQRAGASPTSGIDESQWIISIVAFLMVAGGLILLTAGVFTGGQPPADASSLGNGSPALLGVGGGVMAMLGLTLLIVASFRDWLPGTFMLVLLSWLSFVIGLGILAQGIFDYQPRRNVSIVLGSGVALVISAAALMLARSQKRKVKSGHFSAPWKVAPKSGWSNAGGTSRLH
jgi:general stress protein CsbA